MIQPRLAYAGVVELPQEVCQLPWAPAEENEKQPEYACDFSALELTTEERMEEELSLSEFIPSPVPDSLNAAQNESGKSQLKSSSSLDSNQEIAICFFQEASDPDETSDAMDGNGGTAGLDPDRPTPEVAEPAVFVDAMSATPSLSSSNEQERSAVLGNI